LFGDFVETHLFTPFVVGVALIAYGMCFLWLSHRKKAPVTLTAEDVTWRQALLIGCFQVLALVPGTSRSGATITGALCLGLARPAASELSFFLGLPTMLGAGALSVFDFIKEGYTLTAAEGLFLAVGTVTAFAVSLLSIRFLLDFVKRHSFAPFGVYRIVLGAAVLIFLC
jgi:undecaprenyl-diphosphatase